jgi:hypothetical protein
VLILHRLGTDVILRCERSEPRRMGHGRFSSFEARKSAHLRVKAIAFIPGMTRWGL